jgi:hypothetical protein
MTVGQTCWFASISLLASAAMQTGYACKNIAPLVLSEVWAAQQGTVSQHGLHFVLTRRLTLFKAYALENNQ